MENLFNNVSPINSEISSSNKKETSLGVSYNGEITINKGPLNISYRFWVNLYEQKIGENLFVGMEDMDYESTSIKLGDLPIDDLNKFLSGLRSNGLSTLADSFNLDFDSIRAEIANMINESKKVKAIFGNIKVFYSLTEKERTIYKLTNVITNYNTIGDYAKREFKLEVFDDNNNLIPNGIPTLEQLIEYRKTLK